MVYRLGIRLGVFCSQRWAPSPLDDLRVWGERDAIVKVGQREAVGGNSSFFESRQADAVGSCTPLTAT